MIVPIIGMHRSGTSALAGALHEAGIWMGNADDFLYEGLPENPKGFYENKRFRYLNDGILAKHNYDVKTWELPIPRCELNKNIRTRMGELFADCCKHDVWGWKDPRTALTLNLWVDALDHYGLHDVRSFIIFRNPGSVAQSLLTRNGLEPEQGVKLWLAYNKRIINTWEQIDLNARFVCYERLIADPQFVFEAIRGYLGDVFDEDKAVSFIDPKLARSSVNFDGVDSELKGEAMMIYKYMKFRNVT